MIIIQVKLSESFNQFNMREVIWGKQRNKGIK